ncbi:MAG: radical SAM protein [Lachnospiraceae bacterium]|nr:radical SAM protein [Lachnospiraceae bacterium]MDY5103038.1 radical SAM protein [Agathobacter sp.]MDY5521011.1 radical SAM protein [Agathobacter sp.]
MYIKEKNIYISDQHNIMFDLNEYRIFFITEKLRHYIESGRKTIGDLWNEEEVKILKHVEVMDSKVSYKKGSCDSVKIHVSNTCNLRCRYCYAHGGNYGQPNTLMDRETAERIVYFINRSEMMEKIRYITFFGGEPLMNPDIIEYICSNIQNKDIKFLMQSNGTLMNERIISILKEYDIGLTISLDGPLEINDINRVDTLGNGTYEKIVANMNTLLHQGGKINAIEATLSQEFKKNYRKRQIADYIYQTTGVQAIKVEYDARVDNFDCEKNQIEDSIEDFFDNCINERYIMDNAVYKIMSTFLAKTYKDAICPAGSSVLTIDVNGNIYPCQLFIEEPEWKLGEICEGTIRNMPQTFYKSKNSECIKCVARSTCSICMIRQSREKYCELNRIYQKKVLDKFADLIQQGKFTQFYNSYCSLTQNF